MSKVTSDPSSGPENEDQVTLFLQDKPVSFQLDTGAQVSVLPRRIYDKLKEKPELKHTKVVLVSFTGSKTKPIGKCQILCSHNSVKYELTFFIVDIKCMPLLSKNACKLLGLVKFIDQAKSEPHTEISNDKILQKYKDVFEGLGCLEGELHLEVDSSASPVAHPPRKVPDALRDRLKCEPDDMEKKV